MKRIEALEQLAVLDTSALLDEMRRRGYAGDGSLDDVNTYVSRWMDCITKTSAATLEPMTDWRQVIDHAAGKNRPTANAAALPSDILGVGFRIEFNGPANRVQVLFDKFPPATARQIVKDSGFYWSPTLKCWQRKISVKGIKAAQDVAEKLAALHL